MIKANRSRPATKARHSKTEVAPAPVRTLGKARLTGAAKAAVPAKSSKLEKIITLLRRSKGATVANLAKATDWQAHSVRGAISGTIKKKLGLKVVSEKKDDIRTYRIAG